MREEKIEFFESPMLRDQRRSWWLGIAVADKIVENPERVFALARQNILNIRKNASDKVNLFYYKEWEKLLEQEVQQTINILFSTSLFSREMRQNSPFAGVLSQEERTKVLDAFYANEKLENPG